MRDDLKEILRRADSAMGSPGGGEDVAGRVRRKNRRQRMGRTVGTGVAVVLVGMIGIFGPWNRQMPVVVMAPPAVSATDAKVSEMVAELLEKDVANQKVSEPAVLKPDIDGCSWQLAEERNRTALILVRGTDRIYQQSHDRSAAIAGYREAVRLFPESPAAEVAEQRLRDFEQKGRNS